MPPYAVVGRSALRTVEDELAEDDEGVGANTMDEAFGRFESTQPEVARRVQEVLERPLDETAIALGYFLSIAVWLAFERAFGSRLSEVSRDAWGATVDALALEEDLRSKSGGEPLPLDDLLALEQPDVLAFVHEHIDTALDIDPPLAGLADDGESAAGEMDVLVESAEWSDRRDRPASGAPVVEDVHLVYRTVVLETLALSHAVRAEPHEASPELMA